MKRFLAVVLVTLVVLYAALRSMALDPNAPEEHPPLLMERAETALEVGDLRLARSFARDLESGDPPMPRNAAMVRAIANARDPSATENELRDALDVIGDSDAEVRLEILARLPDRQGAALRGLTASCSVTREVCGDPSPWTLAAYARFEPDPFLRAGELAECRRLNHPRTNAICSDELPRPPLFLFRGAPELYIALGTVFVFTLLVLLLRQTKRAPWIGKLLRWQVGALVACATTAILTPEAPVLGIMATAVIGFLVIAAEPLIYVALLRRGRFRQSSLRRVEPDDERNVQLLRLPRFVMNGFGSGTFFLERRLPREGGAYRMSAAPRGESVPIAWITVRPWWR